MPFPASHPALDSALAARGYADPTPVQAAVLEAEAGRDLLVSAQTGSGKTVAFGLALAPTLLGEADKFREFGAPVALVIAPTRELALQVNAELQWLYAETGARIVSCVGGMDPRTERKALDRGAHIVVGTPGRLRDHLERGALDLSELKAVVLDEADEMLDMGFQEDLTFLLDAAPAERRTLLFSATIARDIAELAKTYQRDALRIDTTTKNAPHGDIEYKAIRVAPNEIELAVVNVLRFFEAPGALVFANTRERVKHLTASLRERGFSVVGLSGELNQNQRSEALQSLRDGHARVCVATDVAARGLDLPDLGLVIHAELPVNKATMLHRSGRTGRAGKKGVSVLIVTYTRRRKAELMLQSASVKAEWSGPPSADEIRAKDEERMWTDPVLTDPADDENLALGRRLLERQSPEQVAAALMRLYRQKLPPPEDVYDDDRMKRQQESRRNDKGEPDMPFQDFARGGDMTWFRINIGREKNADPKWLMPLICRLGHVTKRDIGTIRIFDRDTKFEITADAEARFRAAIAQGLEEGMKIEDTVPPAPKAPFERRGPKPDFKGGDKKPWAGKKDGFRKDRDDRPAREDKPWQAKTADGEKKPWAKKDAAERPARPDKPHYDKQGDKSWARAEGDKKPWKAKPEGGSDGPKKPWTPRAEAHAAPVGERPWTGKPKTGAKPFKGGGKPFKGPKPGGKPFTGKPTGKGPRQG